MVKLANPEGEFYMGLARVQMGKSTPSDHLSLHTWWYERCGKNVHAWPSTTGAKFKQYKDGTAWIHDVLEPESILLQVTDQDLTESGKANAMASPCLSADFIQRLRLFAAHHTSDAHLLVLHVESAASTEQPANCIPTRPTATAAPTPNPTSIRARAPAPAPAKKIHKKASITRAPAPAPPKKITRKGASKAPSKVTPMQAASKRRAEAPPIPPAEDSSDSEEDQPLSNRKLKSGATPSGTWKKTKTLNP
jgi:hypothetical protein